jgi:hypothetical protein
MDTIKLEKLLVYGSLAVACAYCALPEKLEKSIIGNGVLAGSVGLCFAALPVMFLTDKKRLMAQNQLNRDIKNSLDYQI